MSDEYNLDYMILVLANYDYTKVEFVKKNLDVIDFTLMNCFKGFENCLERESYKRKK